MSGCGNIGLHVTEVGYVPCPLLLDDNVINLNSAYVQIFQNKLKSIRALTRVVLAKITSPFNLFTHISTFGMRQCA